jgi:hypothetical protein
MPFYPAALFYKEESAKLNTIPAILSNAPGFASVFACTAISALRTGSNNNPRKLSSNVSGVTSFCNSISAAPAATNTSAFFR